MTASGCRVGDADREATAASLREHYAAGRLTLDEFNERLSAAFAAKTDLDLNRITADLPHVTSGATITDGLWPAAGRAAASSGPWRPRAGRPGAGRSGAGRSGAGRAGSGSGYGQRQGRSRAWDGSPTGRSRASVLVGVILIMIALTVVVAIAAPFALFGLWVSRPVIILLGIFAVARRILRWLSGRPGGPRRRRWLF